LIGLAESERLAELVFEPHDTPSASSSRKRSNVISFSQISPSIQVPQGLLVKRAGNLEAENFSNRIIGGWEFNVQQLEGRSDAKGMSKLHVIKQPTLEVLNEVCGPWTNSTLNASSGTEFKLTA
jgi:hypothetical protein